MAVFRKFKGLHITCNYSHLDPQKALPWPNDVFWRIFRKNPFKFRLASVFWVKNDTPDGTEKTYMGSKNPGRERDKIWQAE